MRTLIGRNMRKYRLQEGLTQEEMSARRGFGQNYLSDLERGRRNPTVVAHWEIAQTLGVTPVDLIPPDQQAKAEGDRTAQLLAAQLLVDGRGFGASRPILHPARCI